MLKFDSKNMGNLWEDLGKAMEGEDEIEVGQVDCGSDKELCSKVDIHSYPTFKLFYNGEEFAKYKGTITLCITSLFYHFTEFFLLCQQEPSYQFIYSFIFLSI